MNTAREVARKLLQIKAIKLNPQNPFTWASGIQSPIYCDNRVSLSYPDVRNYIKHSFVQLSREFPPFDKIAGVATAGIPHGVLLADALQVPFIYVRSKAKAHGRQNQIEGVLNQREKILVIEDLISTGGSSLQAVKALEAAGGQTIGVAAIFTYGFDKSKKAFAAAGYPLKTLSNYNILIEEALKTNYITDSDVELLKTWQQDINQNS